MIPLQLRLSGFLSYRDSVEVDFTTFDLACISGSNGAGKSSLLDAITWSLFGQARKRDESLVNLQSDAAEVTFTFSYEENVYRVQRSLPRGKGTVLEFQVRESGIENREVGTNPDSPISNNGNWRPLTERTLRETQARIEQILRLDYDTFVNAAFFLQGKADQFTQQTASKRKEVLGSILGLEAWETYRVRTAERRRTLEDNVRTIDGRITEIDNELDEEDARKTRLAELERELKGLATARKTQEIRAGQHEESDCFAGKPAQSGRDTGRRPGTVSNASFRTASPPRRPKGRTRYLQQPARTRRGRGVRLRGMEAGQGGVRTHG